MRIIDSTYPITFGARCVGECFKSKDSPNQIFMKVSPIIFDKNDPEDISNAINLQTGRIDFFFDEDEIIPVKATLTIENY